MATAGQLSIASATRFKRSSFVLFGLVFPKSVSCLAGNMCLFCTICMVLGYLK